MGLENPSQDRTSPEPENDDLSRANLPAKLDTTPLEKIAEALKRGERRTTPEELAKLATFGVVGRGPFLPRYLQGNQQDGSPQLVRYRSWSQRYKG